MNFKTAVIFLFLTFTLNTVAQDSLSVEVPTKVLLKKVNQHSFSISPDGKYFVEVIENNIESDIVVIDIDQYKMFQRIPLGSNKVQNVYWLSSNRLIYESSGKIFAIDIDGTNSKLLVSRLANNTSINYYNFYKNVRLNKVASLLYDNPNEILIETYDLDGYSSIKRVNVFTGQKITVLNGKHHKMNKWILDSEGEIRLGMKYDGTSFNYFVNSKDSKKWEQFYLKLNDKEVPLRIDATSYLNQVVSFEGFGYDPDVIYIASNIDSDKRKLLSYNLIENKVVDVLMEDVSCDINDPHGKGVSFLFDHQNGKLAGIRYEGILPLFNWYSKKFNNYHAALNKQYPEAINDVIDSDAKNERFLIHQWSDISAGNIGIYDAKNDTYSVMFHFNTELDDYKLSKTKPIIATSRDGCQIPSYLNLPINYSQDEPVPLVVIPHGGPWSRDYWAFDDFTQYFATRGFAVLRVNFRGSTGFGKKHVLAGVNSIDEIMINDIADAVKYVTNKISVNKKKVFVFGHSYGGYATYMSLLKYPDIYASGVVLSAPTDIKDWMKTQKKDKNYFSYEFWKTALGDNNSKYLSKVSPISYVEDFSKPLLIFHGKNDGTISVDQADNMVQKLREHKKYVRYEVLQNEGHSIHDGNSVGYILDSSVKFFRNSSKE